MNYLFFYLSLFLYANTATSQAVLLTLFRDAEKKIIIDTSILKAVYTYTYVKDMQKPTKVNDDKRILQLGNRLSKCYSYYTDLQDSAVVWAKEAKADVVKGRYGLKGNADPIWSEYYKNYRHNKLTVTTRFVRTDFLYDENLDNQNWTIDKDTLSVLHYTCQKATCRFRGRDYIAWFAPEIPIDNGPWKFGGLPGLILKVQDTKGLFIFECTALEQIKEPIYFIKTDYMETTREKLRKIDQFRHSDAVAFFKSEDMHMDLGNSKYNKTPYNPIELE